VYNCNALKILRKAFVSFIGCILSTKSLSCIVAALIGMPYISESSKYLEFISLIRKKTILWQASVSQASRRLFQCSMKILCRFQTSRSQILSFHPDGLGMRPDAHKCQEAFEQLQVASIWTSWQHVQTLFKVQEDSSFPLQTWIVKTTCIRLDDRATTSRCGPW
jgi:hypothetical protein